MAPRDLREPKGNPALPEQGQRALRARPERMAHPVCRAPMGSRALPELLARTAQLARLERMGRKAPKVNPATANGNRARDFE